MIGDWINQAYSWLDAYQVSPRMLLFFAVALTLAIVLALREAAAWFFKTQDIKHDLARIEEMQLQLEGELHVIQELLRAAGPERKQSLAASTEPVPTEAAPLKNKWNDSPTPFRTKAVETPLKRQFPLG